MRNTLLSGALALSLLGGCATTTGTADTIAQIQATTVAICAFLPTATTIANILAAGNPALATGTAVADAICAAVTAKGRKRGATVSVAGVPIHGKFVR